MAYIHTSGYGLDYNWAQGPLDPNTNVDLLIPWTLNGLGTLDWPLQLIPVAYRPERSPRYHVS